MSVYTVALQFEDGDNNLPLLGTLKRQAVEDSDNVSKHIYDEFAGSSLTYNYGDTKWNPVERLVPRTVENGVVTFGEQTEKYEAEVRLESAKLVIEAGSVGSFRFTMTHDHIAANALKSMVTLIDISEINAPIWRGRVLEITRSLKGIIEVECEGALGFLNDSIFPRHKWGKEGNEYYDELQGALLSDIIKDIITYHNRVMPELKQLEIGVIDEPDKNAAGEPKEHGSIVFETDGTKTCLELLTDVISQYGPPNMIYYVDYRTFYYTDDPEVSRSNSISVDYGKNMIDCRTTESSVGAASIYLTRGEDVEVITSAEKSEENAEESEGNDVNSSQGQGDYINYDNIVESLPLTPLMIKTSSYYGLNESGDRVEKKETSPVYYLELQFNEEGHPLLNYANLYAIGDQEDRLDALLRCLQDGWKLDNAVSTNEAEALLKDNETQDFSKEELEDIRNGVGFSKAINPDNDSLEWLCYPTYVMVSYDEGNEDGGTVYEEELVTADLVFLLKSALVDMEALKNFGPIYRVLKLNNRNGIITGGFSNPIAPSLLTQRIVGEVKAVDLGIVEANPELCAHIGQGVTVSATPYTPAWTSVITRIEYDIVNTKKTFECFSEPKKLSDIVGGRTGVIESGPKYKKVAKKTQLKSEDNFSSQFIFIPE